jgi:hypothetical protein
MFRWNHEHCHAKKKVEKMSTLVCTWVLISHLSKFCAFILNNDKIVVIKRIFSQSIKGDSNN